MIQLKADITLNDLTSFSPNIQNEIIKSATYSNKQEMELGILGRFFGKDIRLSCSFVLIFILSIGALILTWFGHSIWDKITPIITLILGYLFSKYNKHHKK